MRTSAGLVHPRLGRVMRSACFATSLLTLVLAAPCDARADAIRPAPPCEPGMARGGRETMADLGAWMGHGGGPRCEPAVCSDASTCAPRQVCRRDAHCIAPREMMVNTSHGHSAPNPVLTTVDFDLGRCEDDGTCPDGSRCLELSTCRDALLDSAMNASVYGSRGGTPAAGGWSYGTPPEGAPTATPVPEFVEPPPVPEATVETTAPTPEPVAEPSRTAASSPGSSPGCGCSVANRSPVGLLVAFGCALALGRRPRS